MKSILYHNYNPNSEEDTKTDDLSSFLDTIRYEVGNKVLLVGCIGDLGNRLRMLGVNVNILEDSNYADVCYSLVQNTNCNIIKGRLELLPFEDNNFDKVIVLDHFNSINNRDAAIKEIKRVLKCEGEVIIEDLSMNNIKVRMKNLKCKVFGENNTYYYPEQVIELFSKVEIIGKLKEIDNERYIYIGKKNNKG